MMKLKVNKNQIKILQALSKDPMYAADIRYKIGMAPSRFSPQIKALINLYFVQSIGGKYAITQAGRDFLSLEKDIRNKELFK